MNRPLFMRHNFPVVEALEAAGVSIEAFRQVAPGVDPDRLLVREAHPRFQRLLFEHGAFAFPYVIYMHTNWYTRSRAELAPLAIRSALLVSAWRNEGYIRYALASVGDYLRQRLEGRSHGDAWNSIRFEESAVAEATRLLAGAT